jgi:hypothetical protein
VATQDGTIEGVSQYQWRIGTDDAAWAQRLEAARADGMVTNLSGLGKLAFSTAIEHGQAATEAALRNLGAAAVDQHQTVDPAQLDRIEQLVTVHRHDHAQPRQHQDDRADWTTLDWIRADWPKAAALVGWVWLLGIYLPA